MLEFVVALIVLGGMPMLWRAGRRINELEQRLDQLEEELAHVAARAPATASPSVSVPAVRPQRAAQDFPQAPEPGPEPAAAPPAKRPYPAPWHAPVTTVRRDAEREERPAPQPQMPKPMQAQGLVAKPTSALEAQPARDAEPTNLASGVADTAEQEDREDTQISRMAFSFEHLFGRTLPIWVGGITLAIAGVLIVKYAIDVGVFGRIFTPGVQAVTGLLFGLGLIGGAEWAHRKAGQVRDPRVAQALSGAGIAVLYTALLVAANLYDLIAPLAAFVCLAGVTAGALWLSLRHGMPSALLGLAGGLAAPALTVGLDANVPMLAVYLGFTIAGLVGVSRIQRWPWLALMALTGGAGWSLWLVLAGQAMSVLGALSVGTFVLLLAFALPLLAFDGVRASLLRTVSALVGAAQLALLVATGGYAPLHWGLFTLVALAGQWLAWRDRNFAIVPSLSAALSLLLLLLWPDPAPGWLAVFGLTLTALHAVPLLQRLWDEDAPLQRALELGAIAGAIPLVALRHFHAPWGEPDLVGALAAGGGGLLALSGVALGWRARGREEDLRLAILLGLGGLLLALASWLGFPHWQAPLWCGLIAASMLALAPSARDHRIEIVSAAFAGLSLLALFVTLAPARWGEILVLFGHVPVETGWPSLLRWAGLAAIFALFALRGNRRAIAGAACLVTTALIYGGLAQIVPAWSLPLVMAGLAGGLLLAAARRKDGAIEWLAVPFILAVAGLLLVSGPDPQGEWARLIGAADGQFNLISLQRWLAPVGLGLLLALRAQACVLRSAGACAAMAFAYGMLAQCVPGWTLPMALAGVGAIGLATLAREHGPAAGGQVFVLGAGGVALLALSGGTVSDEWSRLFGLGASAPDLAACLRWSAMAALFTLLALRTQSGILQKIGQGLAALLAYGGAAQLVPAFFLPVMPAAGALALAMVRGSSPKWASGLALLTLTAISAGWALLPLVAWGQAALASLIGVPMDLASANVEPVAVLRRLLAPAILLSLALAQERPRLDRHNVLSGGCVLGLIAIVALHSLYRAAFAEVFGADFVAFGLGQRLLWDAILLALALGLAMHRNAGGAHASARAAATVLALMGALHVLYYSLVQHNPLWTAQHVGSVPLANLVVPLCAALPLLMLALGRIQSEWQQVLDRLLQPVLMVMIAMLGWASLRQLFHGTLLIDPGVTAAEDIARSILGIVLAIGYLLWGIRRERRSWRIASLILVLATVAKVFLLDASGLEGLWRIASFVALGFSLIGIGWLYSRQLQREGR